MIEELRQKIANVSPDWTIKPFTTHQWLIKYKSEPVINLRWDSEFLWQVKFIEPGKLWTPVKYWLSKPSYDMIELESIVALIIKDLGE